jgi:hypothetical protein
MGLRRTLSDLLSEDALQRRHNLRDLREVYNGVR